MAENDWSQPSSWSAGGGSMWGAPPQGGMQSPYGGGWGGYGGFQSPYGGGYGGFGGGMPYGGGYGMQSPYGAPGGYGGGYSPYGGMQSPYGGYGMQSPYGGYGMQSPYSAYGMPQQQNMMAPQTQQATAAPQTAQTAELEAEPAEGDSPSSIFDIKGNTSQTTTFKPWENLAQEYQKLFPEAQHEFFRQFGRTDAQGVFHPGQGPLGFDPSSEAALSRMEQLAQGGNPMVTEAQNTTRDIMGGQAGINTGGMFSEMYGRPSISNASQYNQMYNDPGFTGQSRYDQMAGQDAITNAGQYNQAARDLGAGQFDQLYGQSQGPGSLAGGQFGQVASGALSGKSGNPYREAAIQQAMADTGDQVKATMSSRGRFGSDAYGDAMGRALGNVATTARMQGYDTDTQNMMAAAQARSQEALSRGGQALGAAQGAYGAEAQSRANQLAAATGISGLQGTNAQQRLAALGQMNQMQNMTAQQRMAAASGLSGIQGTNWQNQLGALQGMTGVQGQNLQNRMEAAGMAPTMQGLRYDDASRLAQAGAAREAMAQQQKDFGWQQMNQYRGILGNLPGAAGQQSQEANQPWWQTALGIAGTLGGIWGGAGG